MPLVTGNRLKLSRVTKANRVEQPTPDRYDLREGNRVHLRDAKEIGRLPVSSQMFSQRLYRAPNQRIKRLAKRLYNSLFPRT